MGMGWEIKVTGNGKFQISLADRMQVLPKMIVLSLFGFSIVDVATLLTSNAIMEKVQVNY